MPGARSEGADPSRRTGRPGRLVASAARVRRFGRRRRIPITVVGSLATAAVLVFVLAGRRHEFAAAVGDATVWVLAVAVLLQSSRCSCAARRGI